MQFLGNVIELANVKAFVMDDGSLLATNQVLVINNTGRELPLWVYADRRVRVMGVIYPRAIDGGMSELISMSGSLNQPMPVDPVVTQEGMDTTPVVPGSEAPMTDMGMRDMNMVNPLSLEVVPERLQDWVILEIVAIEDLTHIVE